MNENWSEYFTINNPDTSADNCMTILTTYNKSYKRNYILKRKNLNYGWQLRIFCSIKQINDLWHRLILNLNYLGVTLKYKNHRKYIE